MTKKIELMYFKDRQQAGELLAEKLYEKYRYEDCAVVALNAGGVLVGKPLAEKLHAVLSMIVTEEIHLPGDTLVVGSVSQDGNFVYNSNLTSFEIQDYFGEFFHSIDDEKRVAFHKINRLIGDGGAFDKDLLQNRIIILVSDGLSDGSVVGAAMDYLKPVRVKKVVIALPIATAPVVDFLHVKVDEMHILDVKDDFIDGIRHYYDDNYIPDSDEIIDMLNEAILGWKQNDY
jgi:Predicted phosphoribosyltransferases